MSFLRLRRFTQDNVVPPTPVAWTPNALSPAVWYDPSDSSTMTLNGSLVSQMNDKSSNGRHAVQATEANQPTLTTNAINGRNTITFNGTSSVMLVTNATSMVNNVSYVGLFGVMSTSNNVANQAFFNIPTTSTSSAIFSSRIAGVGILRQGGRRLFTDSFTFTDSASNTVATNEVFLYEGYQDFSIPANFVLKNGIQVATTNPFITSGNIQSTDVNNSTFLGALSNSTQFFPGQLGELVIVTSALSTLDRQRLEGYLAHRWGLQGSLDGSHPFKSSPPTV